VKDVKLIQTLGVRESGLLASISDYHVFHKFQPGGQLQAANLCLDAVQLALDAGIRPRLHLEDASRAAIDFIRYFVQVVLERAEVSLTKDSGVAGLIFVARKRLQKEFRKEDPPIQAANEWMLRQFDEGRQTAVEWEEIADFFGR
jgi:hypothetical protein